MEAKIVGSLVIYGPLGVITILLTLAVIKLYRDIKSEREAFLTKMDAKDKICHDELVALQQAHHEEMVALHQRYIETSNTQVEKYHQLSNSMIKVLESLERRLNQSPR